MANSYFFTSQLAHGDPLEYIKNREKSTQSYINYMLLRLHKMFKYKNLPKTVPHDMLEFYLMCNGHCFFTKVKGEPYVLLGSFGGEPEAYYKPTKYVVANPYLKLTKEYEIDTDGILMRNDSLWIGLYPLMARYASMMAENLITLRSADVMLRVLAMLTAPDDKTKTAAENYLKKLENGDFGVIAENRLFEGVKMQSPPSNNGSYLTQFIELHQYLKGSFYNEIGLNANFNMKREAIGDGETSLNKDSLFPLCDEMLDCRKEDVKKVNEMFDLNIEVELDSSWANNILELELEHNQMTKGASRLGNVQTETEDTIDENTERTKDSINTEENNKSRRTEENAGSNAEETTKASEEFKTDENIGEKGENSNDSTDEPNEVNVNVNINIETDEEGEEDEKTERDDTI